MVKYGVTVKVCAIKSCSFPLSDPSGSFRILSDLGIGVVLQELHLKGEAPSESPAAIVGTMRWQCPSLQHEGFDVNG